MNRLWAWGRGWNKRPAEERGPELREFVYLDEVSVTSLLSSRLGKMPSEFTDTLTSATKAELNSSIQASAAVLKAGVGSRVESTSGEDSKVVSKATIQASFKRLYAEEMESLVVRPMPLTEPAPAARLVAEALSSGSDELKPWVISPRGLRRGRLAEMEVELQADPAFRASTIVTTFAELANESGTLLALAGRDVLEKAIELNRILEKLMGGLVPLRCRVVDYRAASVREEQYLVHKRAVERLSVADRPASSELVLVGVAEKSLFWKDIRRVLFSKGQFRVLCRLNHDALRTSWTAVKLIEVLGEVAPNLERQLDVFGRGLLSAMTTTASTNERLDAPWHGVLMTFGELLAEQVGYPLDQTDRRQIEAYAKEAADLPRSTLDRRKAFGKVTEWLSARTAVEVTPTMAAQVRSRACQQHGLIPGGLTLQTPITSPAETTGHGAERFLDAEIIAIYW